jgi:hypothetical protein
MPLDGVLYVIGGRSDSLTGQTNAILAIDPLTGAVRRAGHLPTARSDVAAVAGPRGIIVVGGRDAAGGAQDEILMLRPRP